MTMNQWETDGKLRAGRVGDAGAVSAAPLSGESLEALPLLGATRPRQPFSQIHFLQETSSPNARKRKLHIGTNMRPIHFVSWKSKDVCLLFILSIYGRKGRIMLYAHGLRFQNVC